MNVAEIKESLFVAEGWVYLSFLVFWLIELTELTPARKREVLCLLACLGLGAGFWILTALQSSPSLGSTMTVIGFSLGFALFDSAAAVSLFAGSLFLRPWELLASDSAAYAMVGQLPRLCFALCMGHVFLRVSANSRGVRENSWRWTMTALALVGLTLWCFLATLFAPDPAASQSAFYDGILRSVSLYFLLSYLVRSPGQLRVLLVTLLMTFLAVGGMSLFQLFVQSGQAGVFDARLARLARLEGFGAFANANDVAALMVLVLPLAGSFALSKREPTPLRILAAALTALSLTTIALTRSRGASLGVAAVFLALPVLRRCGKVRLKLLAAVAASILACASLYLFALSSRSSEDLETSSAGRMTYLKAGIRMGVKNPVFGVGFDAYPASLQHYSTESLEEDPQMTAHNSWVLVFAETGLIGCLLFIAAFGASLQRAWLIRDRKPEFFLSILGYGVSMTFLSHSYLIYPYLLYGLIESASASEYEPRGVGGGGAMAGLSISPNGDLRFIGTDMGTLYRSVDRGKTWSPVSQREVQFSSDLSLATGVGFSSNERTVFFANAGKDPKRSDDQGVHWKKIDLPLRKDEVIRYWLGDPEPRKMFCATNQGLLSSEDLGESWQRQDEISGDAKGSWIDPRDHRFFHAVPDGILVSVGPSGHFKWWYRPPPGVAIRAFAGGGDSRGTTLAFIDDQGKRACAWAEGADDALAEQIKTTEEDCGYVWVNGHPEDPAAFRNTQKEAGRYLRMAANDPRTIYVTGGDWIRQYGSKVWVSTDAGKSWEKRFQIYDWDQRPYRPWPRDRLEYSAVGLDVGWDDNAFLSFEVNPRNSSEAGGSGLYFLHMTEDRGAHWLAPFTRFADEGARERGKRWSSTGLEVTSFLHLKFHPGNPRLGYASVCDLGGAVTEDGGKTWRIAKAKYNTNYDYAFDPSVPDRVFAASGNQHDFPVNMNTPIHGEGGVFASDNRGRSWRRLTPETKEWNRQFISIAYDPVHRVIYAGTQGGGVARSRDQGEHWDFFNSGLPRASLVVPQIEVDPKSGAVYALLTGDAPEFSLSSQGGETGVYRYDPGAAAWRLLRGKIIRPADVSSETTLWLFPSAFAVDFSKSDRSVIWLADMENRKQWLSSGVWKTTDGGRTWSRQIQITHPTALSLDPRNPDIVSVSSLDEVSGKWGNGGAWTTFDGGRTWKKNETLPFEAILDSFTPDPSRLGYGFYLFFGGGMLYGHR